MKESSVKVPRFGSNRRDYEYWADKMMARALVAGYRDLLVGDIPIPTATDAKSLKIKDASKLTGEETRTLKNARLSEQGFAELTLAIDTETQEGKVCYSLIKKTKKGGFPNGNLAQAWANLKIKYGGMELSDLDDYNKQYQSACTGKGQDPDTFINYMKSWTMRLTMIISFVIF